MFRGLQLFPGRDFNLLFFAPSRRFNRGRKNNKMEVKYLDLQSQFKDNREVRRAIDEILSSGQFVMGPAVEEFERNFAELRGVRRAIGVSNGTDAIFLALKVLGIGEGDEVIITPNTFLATVGAIVQAGAFSRPVDITDDYNIDPDKIEYVIQCVREYYAD